MASPVHGDRRCHLSMIVLFFRWNSVLIMLVSIVEQEAAVVQTIQNVENVPVYFTPNEWRLMRKVVGVLKPFHEITLMLSQHDASISMTIPTVTLIFKSLEENPREDQGVLGLKRALKKGMDERFYDIETKEHFIVSTLLDSRYKKYFYRDPNTLDRAKCILTEKLVERLREDARAVQVCKHVLYRELLS